MTANGVLLVYLFHVSWWYDTITELGTAWLLYFQWSRMVGVVS